ncbi:PleD family two-component system response regulator [Candidatus Omnitrophota bacterium]
MKKYTVLVVDDEEITLHVIKKILENARYRVVLAKNGKEALQQAKKYSPDVIIMDIMMPELDGISSILKMKAYTETKSIPIIVCTIVKEEDDKIIAQNLGAVDYIRKDQMNSKDLIEKIERALKK